MKERQGLVNKNIFTGGVAVVALTRNTEKGSMNTKASGIADKELDKSLILKLSSCPYINEGRHLIPKERRALSTYLWEILNTKNFEHEGVL